MFRPEISPTATSLQMVPMDLWTGCTFSRVVSGGPKSDQEKRKSEVLEFSRLDIDLGINPEDLLFITKFVWGRVLHNECVMVDAALTDDLGTCVISTATVSFGTLSVALFHFTNPFSAL